LPAEAGLYGTAPISRGRGGQFDGLAAAIRHRPAAADNRPVSGPIADLFVDKGGRLW
jgi:hypothetical protein